MVEKYNKSEIYVWSPLIGFDKNDADRGAGGMLSNIPFLPHGVSPFLYHMDIILQHEGMEEEKVFPPDMCSYYGSDRNGQRERQAWTNYELRELIGNLNASGTQTYLSIMADLLNNQFHDEWIYEHPEVIYDAKTEKGALNVFRRFKDGTFFEDFFIDKLCRTLTDYGFSAFLPTDLFCPMCLRISMGDYSSDMLEQFAAHTGLALPDDIHAALGDDANENKIRRGDWLWEEHRAEWIRFYAWRWGVFWKKLCDRVHAIGKKVMSLGVYCTDPFENYYCMGIDLKILAESGIDEFMPNVVPTGMRLQHPDWRDPYFNYMYMLPLISAFVPQKKLITMLGVRDDTEEWDILHHAPCNLERDIYMMTGFMRKDKAGYKRCTDGFMVCLGDSLRSDDWAWLTQRLDAGCYDGAEKAETPTLIWSDHGFYNLLPAYIKTRRWTTHKYAYELANRGTLVSCVARIEDLDTVEGNLIVPNFDLLSDEEKKKLAAYRRGAVVCTAMKDFVPEHWGIQTDICFYDKFSDCAAMAFAFNCHLRDETREKIAALLSQDDGKPNISADELGEYECTILRETLKFTKVTDGFADSVALLARNTGTEMITCNMPISVMKLKNGKYRVSVYNTSLIHYGYAIVSCAKPIKNVEHISHYPVLPVKYMQHATDSVGFAASRSDGTQCHFRLKVAPGGMSISEIEI